MSAVQAIIVIGVFTVIVTATVVVMARMNSRARQRIQRRREAWKAAGGIGHCPGDGSSASAFLDLYNNISFYGGP
jgi:hypothetical protein